MGVGHESLDVLVKIAASFGLHAKLTGAGGGGCGFILIKGSFNVHQLELLKEKLSQQNFEFYETSIGGAGVKIVTK